MQRKKLAVKLLGRGFAWLDTGTHESLLEAGAFVQTLERRQGLKMACLEEIGLNNKWISINTLENIVLKMGKSEYGIYLKELINQYK